MGSCCYLRSENMCVNHLGCKRSYKRQDGSCKIFGSLKSDIIDKQRNNIIINDEGVEVIHKYTFEGIYY